MLTPRPTRLAICGLFLSIALLSAAAFAQTPTVELSRDSQASLVIMFSDKVSDEVRKNVGELAEYLERMSGAKFAVETGDGSHGIVVGRPSKGTQVVGGWASRIANWAPRNSGKLLDSSGREAFDFGKAEEGWVNVQVPESEEGKLWKFENSQGQRLLMTVPPYLARTSEGLLLPAEVIEKDSSQ